MLRTILCICLVTLASAADWTVGWKPAADLASKTNKPILANFTGSDWCGWCIKLKAEVFSTPEFAAWAAKNVVLLEVDFPRDNKQSATQQAENEALLNKYKVEGFPTILLLAADGKELGRFSYQRGGPMAWTAAVDAILAGAH